jgi:hypothetical protein
MSTLSQFVGGSIKSIQRGVINIAGPTSTLSNDITISAVNMAKSELRLTGTASSGAASLSLTGPTTLNVTRSTVSVAVAFGWEVTEWR